LEEIRKYLNVIKRAISIIEGILDNDDGGLLEKLSSPTIKADPIIVPKLELKKESPPVITGPSPEEIQQWKEARKKHIESLMAIDCWIPSIPQQNIIVPTEKDNILRANAVLDMMMDKSLAGMYFLDFGCGEGWVAKQALSRGVIESVGYDIIGNENWNKIEKVRFETDFHKLPKQYFDVVFLYDVLDHCLDPLELMGQIKEVIKPNGSIHVRCHPWTSIHGTHLYKQGINKAYFHLFLKYEEIEELIGQKPMFTREEKNPLEAYHWWFSSFQIRKENLVRNTVSDFFHVPAFKDLLANEQKIDNIDAFLKTMEISFVDFVLGDKK